MALHDLDELDVKLEDDLNPFPDRTPQPLSFSVLIGLLRRAKRLILISGAIGLALGAMVAFLLPPTYTATSSFVPPGSSSAMSGSAALMMQLSAMGGAGLLGGGKTSGELYVGILKSESVARMLIDRFHLLSVYKVKKVSQAEKQLAASSLFTADTKSSIVTISVKDKSPELARDLANAYLQALQETSANLALTESSQRRLFYEERLVKEKDALADAEVALKQSQEKSGLIAPMGQTATHIQALAQMQAQITDREVRLSALLHEESDENPDVLRLRDEIATLRTQLSQAENGTSARQYGFSNAQMPALELDYIRKARDVKYHESLFEIIAKQYEAARIDEAKDAPLQVLDRASVPDTKSGPHRTLIMLLGLIAGVAFGAARVILRAAA